MVGFDGNRSRLHWKVNKFIKETFTFHIHVSRRSCFKWPINRIIVSLRRFGNFVRASPILWYWRDTKYQKLRISRFRCDLENWTSSSLAEIDSDYISERSAGKKTFWNHRKWLETTNGSKHMFVSLFYGLSKGLTERNYRCENDTIPETMNRVRCVATV